MKARRPRGRGLEHVPAPGRGMDTRLTAQLSAQMRRSFPLPESENESLQRLMEKLATVLEEPRRE